MGKIIDLSGQVFGKLTVLDRAGGGGNGKAVTWTCACECGETTVASRSNLRNGVTRSCGCTEGVTHGLTRSREYSSWRHIKNRCNNPNTDGFENYGGRGIKVCERWAKSFAAFYADMGPKPSARHSVDRIDPDGNYEPGNCRWATPQEQRLNQRSRDHDRAG